MHLKALSLEDALQVAKLVGDEAVSRWTANIPHPCTVADAELWIRQFALVRGKTGFTVMRDKQIVACVCYWPASAIRGNEAAMRSCYEIGYWVGQRFWGQGIATAAIKLMFSHPEFPPAHHLVARIFKGNESSARVLYKLGFAYAYECTLQREGITLPGQVYVKSCP